MRTPLLLFGTMSCMALSAQIGTSRGTEFWITYMENLDLGGNGDPYLYIVVSSAVNTQGELQVPATGDAFPFTVSAGHSTIVFVPSLYLYPVGAETYYANGLRVVSDDPVGVQTYHHRLFFSDATLVLPVEQLGDAYLVLAQLDVAQTAPSEFVVLATQNATEVEIVPAVTTASLRPADVPFTITLDQGEVFQLQAFDDLTGTRVRSLDPAKPVAVFAGSKYGNENCMGATDHFFTELMPIERWGDRYALVPYLDRGGDDFKFISKEDATTITLSTGLGFTLDSAEFVTQHITSPVIVESDQAFAVAQLNESQACNLPGNGDGCMAFIPPLDHMEQLAIFQSITGPGMPGGGWTPDDTLNIVAGGQPGAIDVDLDGIGIGPLFAAMPSAPVWSYAQLNIAEGEHVISSTSPFQAQASGFGDYNSYTFYTGFTQEGGTGFRPMMQTSAGQASCIVTMGPFAIDLAGIDASTIDVIDARGRSLVREVVRSTWTQMDASTWAIGPYALIVRDASENVVLRQRLNVVR